ncbi:MAG: DUF2997 domain-containing protein [Candidatus Lokiarchaeota archaeon]|nr:DUF2997 domain-containing protein [Candidatus Harpocratesius repetitus]
MSDEKIIIMIDEDGKIQADAIGFKGNICLKELEKLLEGLPEIEKLDKKPDFYQKNVKYKHKTILK